MAIQTFDLDPQATALEDAPKSIRNETGGLVEGDLLYVTGWSEAQVRFLVAKADADVAGAAAVLVLRAPLADVTDGEAFRSHRLTGLDTSAGVVGDPVYLDATTPGGFTLTAPSASSAIRQVIGRIAVVHATTGEIEFDLLEAAAVEAIGSNELQPDSITAAEIAAGAVTNAELDSTAAKDNLDALSDTAREYVKTNPASGEFPIVSVQRQADGKMDVEYDDVPIV